MNSGIYMIIGSEDRSKFYIGSSFNIYRRKNEHWSLLNRNIHENRKLNNYYNKYGTNSLEFNIIELCDENVLVEREQFYIDLLKPYFNIRPYAHNNRGMRLSDETKKRMSESHKKLFREGRRQWNEGIPCSEETKLKISETNKGMQNMLGKHHSNESKLKMSIARKGKPRSEETKLKISEALKKYIKTPEHCNAISLSQQGNKYNLGKKLSNETKQKISNAKKKHLKKVKK